MFVIKKVNGLDCYGIIFCYLLLLIYSGFFVYINGVFVVIFNRWCLYEKLEDDKKCIEVKWNSILMEDFVLCVYISFFEDVKLFVLDDDFYVFYLLWLKVFEVD